MGAPQHGQPSRPHHFPVIFSSNIINEEVMANAGNGLLNFNSRVADSGGNFYYTAFNVVPGTNPDRVKPRTTRSRLELYTGRTSPQPVKLPIPTQLVSGGELTHPADAPNAIFGANFTIERRDSDEKFVAPTHF